MTSSFPTTKAAHKPHLKAIEIREELASYILNGRRVEWQNDCM
jgi:hypothetical protein